jgi:hypothetical protein
MRSILLRKNLGEHLISEMGDQSAFLGTSEIIFKKVFNEGNLI